MNLRPYQERSLLAIERCLFDVGQNRLLIKKPTGTGKTVTFAALPKRERLDAWRAKFSKRGAWLLVIAHREELLDQAADKIRRQNPGLMVDIEQGERKASRYADVVIASIQTLAARSYTRLERLLKWHEFRVVIVDEAHHAAAATYRTTLARLGFLPMADASEQTETEAATYDDVAVMSKALEGWDAIAPKDRLLLGFTATPNRTDAIGLGCVFQTIAYNYELKQAIDDGYLVGITPWVIETAESLDAVRMSHGDFNQKDLSEAVNTPRRNRLSVDAWGVHARGLSTIAFTVDVQHAHDLAAAFRAEGVRAEALSGETPRAERASMLARFMRGELDLVANCMVLTEGTDLPLTGCILHAKPTKSATLYEQMTGRGLRPHPDDPVGPERLAYRGVLRKSECIVLDLCDVARKHSLQTAAVLYGLPPGLKTAGQDLAKTAEELAALREKFRSLDVDAILAQGRLSLEELRDRASTFDVWTIPDLGAFGVGRAFNWIKTGIDTFRLQYPWSDGIEILQVARDLLDKWEVICTIRPAPSAENPRPLYRQRTLATGVLSSEAAAGLAEAFILQERRSVAKMKAPDAPWRGSPASPKQLALLARWRIPHNPQTVTKGQASDLLDLASARKGARG